MRLPGRTPKRLAAGTRLLGCAVALAAMLGQVGSFAHLAFTAHVRCAEHGELIEAGATSTMATVYVRATHASYSAAESNAAHGHEHCLLAPNHRDRAAHSLARTLVATGQLAFVDRIVEPIGPPRAIDLILLAPKNSPPA